MAGRGEDGTPQAEAAWRITEAVRVFARLRWKGVTIPPTDCLIAAVALRRKLLLYANDTDFDDVPGLQCYKP